MLRFKKFKINRLVFKIILNLNYNLFKYSLINLNLKYKDNYKYNNKECMKNCNKIKYFRKSNKYNNNNNKSKNNKYNYKFKNKYNSSHQILLIKFLIISY